MLLLTKGKNQWSGSLKKFRILPIFLNMVWANWRLLVLYRSFFPVVTSSIYLPFWNAGSFSWWQKQGFKLWRSKPSWHHPPFPPPPRPFSSCPLLDRQETNKMMRRLMVLLPVVFPEEREDKKSVPDPYLALLSYFLIRVRTRIWHALKKDTKIHHFLPQGSRSCYFCK